MSKLRLSLACWNYDRTRALMDGRCSRTASISTTSTCRSRRRSSGCCGIASSTSRRCRCRRTRCRCSASRGRSSRSRSFRRAFSAIRRIYVNANAGIREPKDLIGKRIGTPEYQMTAPVWIRGILAEHYGVPVDSVTYCTGGEEEPGRYREDQARPAAQHQGRADRRDADAVGDARVRRDRRAAYGAHAVDVLDGRRSGAAAVPELQGGRAGVLPRDRHLPDDAHGRHPPRGVRAEPLDRAVALQGVRRGAEAHLRGPVRHRRAEGHAAVADVARRGDARADGRRLLAVRLRTATGGRCRRSCAITTSRACRSAC